MTPDPGALMLLALPMRQHATGAVCSVAALLVLALSACERHEPVALPPATSSANAPATRPAPPAGPAAKVGTTASDAAIAVGQASAARGDGSASVPAADRDFISLALSSGLMEVEAAELALERSTNEQLRSFAQRMLDEHAKGNQRLRALAGSLGLSNVPKTMTDAHRGMVQRLRGLDRQAFDREYAKQVGVVAHREAIGVYERAAADAGQPEVRSFAEKTLPALRDHLQQAEALAKAMGSRSSG